MVHDTILQFQCAAGRSSPAYASAIGRCTVRNHRVIASRFDPSLHRQGRVDLHEVHPRRLTLVTLLQIRLASLTCLVDRRKHLDSRYPVEFGQCTDLDPRDAMLLRITVENLRCIKIQFVPESALCNVPRVAALGMPASNESPLRIAISL